MACSGECLTIVAVGSSDPTLVKKFAVLSSRRTVAILPQPDTQLSPSGHLRPREKFCAELLPTVEGDDNQFLRLTDGRGFVSMQSRKRSGRLVVREVRKESKSSRGELPSSEEAHVVKSRSCDDSPGIAKVETAIVPFTAASLCAQCHENVRVPRPRSRKVKGGPANNVVVLARFAKATSSARGFTLNPRFILPDARCLQKKIDLVKAMPFAAPRLFQVYKSLSQQLLLDWARVNVWDKGHGYWRRRMPTDPSDTLQLPPSNRRQGQRPSLEAVQKTSVDLESSSSALVCLDSSAGCDNAAFPAICDGPFALQDIPGAAQTVPIEQANSHADAAHGKELLALSDMQVPELAAAANSAELLALPEIGTPPLAAAATSCGRELLALPDIRTPAAAPVITPGKEVLALLDIGTALPAPTAGSQGKDMLALCDAATPAPPAVANSSGKRVLALLDVESSAPRAAPDGINQSESHARLDPSRTVGGGVGVVRAPVSEQHSAVPRRRIRCKTTLPAPPQSRQDVQLVVSPQAAVAVDSVVATPRRRLDRDASTSTPWKARETDKHEAKFVSKRKAKATDPEGVRRQGKRRRQPTQTNESGALASVQPSCSTPGKCDRKRQPLEASQPADAASSPSPSCTPAETASTPPTGKSDCNGASGGVLAARQARARAFLARLF